MTCASGQAETWLRTSFTSAVEQVVGGERQEQVVGRAAAEHVFSLLSQVRPLEQFGEVGPDEGRSRDAAARDVAPVRAVEADRVGSTHAGGPLDLFVYNSNIHP